MRNDARVGSRAGTLTPAPEATAAPEAVGPAGERTVDGWPAEGDDRSWTDAGLDRLRRSWRRRPAVWLAGALLIVLAALAAATLAPAEPPAAPAPAPTAPAAASPVVAHGLVRPIHAARVATQAGGVVQTLLVRPGDPVDGQRQIAVVQGLAGAETLTAPFAGTVTDVPVQQGDTVLPGALVATVGDLSAYQVETVDADEYVVARVRAGQMVAVAVGAATDRSLRGVVRTVGLEPAPSSGGVRTYRVVVALLDPPADLRGGMSARLEFAPAEGRVGP